MCSAELLPNIHPGEILRTDFMAPLGLSAGDVASRSGLAVDQVEAVTGERVELTAEIDAGLGRALGTSAGYWLRLQAAFDRMEAEW